MSNLICYKDYHASIEFSAEDGMFIGSVIGVRDSLNFHGFSVQEITQAFHDCVDGYLDLCESLGRSPDKEYKGSFNIRIPSGIHRAADLEARKEGVSLNQFVQSAIELKLSSLESNTEVHYIVIDSTQQTPGLTPAFRSHSNYGARIPVSRS